MPISRTGYHFECKNLIKRGLILEPGRYTHTQNLLEYSPGALWNLKNQIDLQTRLYRILLKPERSTDPKLFWGKQWNLKKANFNIDLNFLQLCSTAIASHVVVFRDVVSPTSLQTPAYRSSTFLSAA